MHIKSGSVFFRSFRQFGSSGFYSCSMKSILRIFFACFVVSVLFFGCCQSEKEKPKCLWFTADANFERFSDKDSIRYYLDKTIETGFNHIIVDVKGLEGVMYDSQLLPVMTECHGIKSDRDWDYLQFFIDEARKRDLDISVSATIFPVGSPYWQEGPVFHDESLRRITCTEYTPEGMMKIEDDREKVAAFMNPVLPESQDFALNIIKEIITKYDIDGFCLDYCRFPDAESDFSDATKVAFEKYIEKKLDKFPDDVFVYADDGTRIPGKYYRQWWEFRSMVIRDFIARVKDLRDEVKPDMKLEYWAASWLHAIYTQGQNWASPRAEYYMEYTDDWANEGYGKTGFADLIDVFMTGTYLERVWGMDDPESIEYGIARTLRDIDGDCTVCGSIYAQNWKDFEDAVYVSLSRTAGLVVFDIVQVIEFDLWDEIRRGIKRAESEMKR